MPNPTNHTDPSPLGALREPRTAASPIPRWITCNGCAARWTGLNTCHCSACHRTFTGITAFDKHRRAGECINPAEVGLVAVNRGAWHGWGRPGERPPR